MTKAEIIYGLVIAIFAAPGFWQYFISPLIEKRRKNVDPRDAAMIGLLHERLWDEWIKYRNRKESTGKGLSLARFNYLEENIYGPYKALGGNADAEDIMNDLRSLIDER